MTTEADLTINYTVGFEDGGRGHKPRDVGGLQNLEKALYGFSSRAFRWNPVLLTPRV